MKILNCICSMLALVGVSSARAEELLVERSAEQIRAIVTSPDVQRKMLELGRNQRIGGILHAGGDEQTGVRYWVRNSGATNGGCGFLVTLIYQGQSEAEPPTKLIVAPSIQCATPLPQGD